MFSVSEGHRTCLNPASLVVRSKGAVWMPDEEFNKISKKPILYPDEETATWELPPRNGETAPRSARRLVRVMASGVRSHHSSVKYGPQCCAVPCFRRAFLSQKFSIKTRALVGLSTRTSFHCEKENPTVEKSAGFPPHLENLEKQGVGGQKPGKILQNLEKNVDLTVKKPKSLNRKSI